MNWLCLSQFSNAKEVLLFLTKNSLFKVSWIILIPSITLKAIAMYQLTLLEWTKSYRLSVLTLSEKAIMLQSFVKLVCSWFKMQTF